MGQMSDTVDKPDRANTCEHKPGDQYERPGIGPERYARTGRYEGQDTIGYSDDIDALSSSKEPDTHAQDKKAWQSEAEPSLNAEARHQKLKERSKESHGRSVCRSVTRLLAVHRHLAARPIIPVTRPVTRDPTTAPMIVTSKPGTIAATT